MIDDLLPAGFEMENPRIATSDADEEEKDDAGEADNDSEDNSDGGPATTTCREGLARGLPARPRRGIRDDRLVVFANLRETGMHKYRYVAAAGHRAGGSPCRRR